MLYVIRLKIEPNYTQRYVLPSEYIKVTRNGITEVAHTWRKEYF